MNNKNNTKTEYKKCLEKKEKISLAAEEIMSDFSKKDLLLKWVDFIYSDVENFVHYYHIRGGFVDPGVKESLFEANWRYKVASERIKYLTPVLEDLVNEKLYGIEDIMIAIYGITSDEVFVLREFLRLEERKNNSKDNEFDVDYMGRLNNGRLYDILTGKN